jgi:hypothetical protein
MSFNVDCTTFEENGDMAVIGYARVSSTGQSLDVQTDKLAACERVFTEKRSGAGDLTDFGRSTERLSVAEGHRAIVLSARYTENAATKLHYAVEALNNNLQTFIE